MTDYIKREDAIDAFEPGHNQDWYTPWIVDALKALPPADVAPVRHGRWNNDAGAQKCSVCEMSFSDLHPLYERATYCPNCGAKMNEEDNNE